MFWFGFMFLAFAVSGLQLMLDRGERLDWFGSTEIIIEAMVALLAFYLFVVHVLTTDRPFLQPHLLRDRNYAVGSLLGLVFGMLYFSTLVLQPTMLQDLRGYPDSLIGILQGSRGLGLLFGALFLLVFMKHIDPRVSIFFGFMLQGIAGYAMSPPASGSTCAPAVSRMSRVTWSPIAASAPRWLFAASRNVSGAGGLAPPDPLSWT